MSETDTRWPGVKAGDATSLTEARLQLHWAAQVPGRLGQTLASPAEDASHTSLSWNHRSCGLESPPVGEGKHRLALLPAERALGWMRPDGTAAARLMLEGSTLAECVEWSARRAGVPGLDALDHDLPDHRVGKGDRFRLDDMAEAARRLAAWFAGAAAVLEPWSARPGGSPLRCWPHHFDIATLITLDEGGGEEARSIGMGMAPGDDSIPEPYFYVLPWPAPSPAPASRLAGGGRWWTDGFTAAVLVAEEITREGDAARQEEKVRAFLEQAHEKSLEIIGAS